jgi:predicted PurR-regulated permease PerM
MSEKKTVNRNVAVALGIICIILIGGLVGVFAYYMPIVNDNSNTISSLHAQVDNLNFTVANLQNQTSNIHIWSTEHSSVWVNNQTVLRSGQSWSFANVPSAGYVCVLVSSNTSTIVQMAFVPSNGTAYEQQTNVGFGGIVVFPQLPSTLVVISVGPLNISPVPSNSFTVTAIYYY